MRKKFCALAFLILILIPVGFIAYQTYFKNNGEELNVVSPIPDFLNLSQNKQVSSISVWLPVLTNFFFGESNAPQISAKSALIFDTSTGKALYEKNSKARLPMASLTKIMTAIISLENKREDDQYIVRQEDLVGEDSMGLTAGEKLHLEDLLYGLMLVSGNDAAETLANNFPGGRVKFIEAMNEKTKALGLKDTNFSNPTGLEGDGKQYTTVYDLLVVTNYALNKFPIFVKAVSTFDYNIPYSANHKAFYLENETNLLTSYPGVKGVKTGYTPEAGLCLVTYLDYQGHRIIGVILGSDNRRGEMIELLDFALRSIGITPPKHG